MNIDGQSSVFEKVSFTFLASAEINQSFEILRPYKRDRLLLESTSQIKRIFDKTDGMVSATSVS